MAKIDLGQIVGKSAYQSAVEGGYTKSEAEFNHALGNMDEVGSAKQVLLLSASWIENGEIFTQEVVVNNVTAADNPVMSVLVDSVSDEEINNILSNFSYIYRGITDTNKITFYATEKPSIDLTIILTGLKKNVEINSDLNGAKIQIISKTDYDALETTDSGTIYFIYEE